MFKLLPFVWFSIGQGKIERCKFPERECNNAAISAKSKIVTESFKWQKWTSKQMVAANNIPMFNAETNKQSNNEGNSNIYDGKYVSNKIWNPENRVFSQLKSNKSSFGPHSVMLKVNGLSMNMPWQEYIGCEKNIQAFKSWVLYFIILGLYCKWLKNSHENKSHTHNVFYLKWFCMKNIFA